MRRRQQASLLLILAAFSVKGCGESSLSDAVANNTEDLPILCRDEKDNDGDGRVDCEDPDCQPLYTCSRDDSDAEDDSSLDPDADMWAQYSSRSIEIGANDSDPSESPSHIVWIASFELMRTEVTVAQYRACVEDGGCEDTSPSAPCASDEYLALIGDEPERYPMNCLSWHQAAAFCAWFGGRLPSESEWERAASNGQFNNTHPWGDDPATCDFAVIDDGVEETSGCGLERPWPVCSKEEGNTIRKDLCDVIGNVQEWVEDDVHRDYTGAPTNSDPWIDDPRGEGRVVRGGSYFDGPEITAMTRHFCDTADGCDISDEMDGYGVRCAR